MSSALPGFFKLETRERVTTLASLFDLTDEEIHSLGSPDRCLDMASTNTMVENAVGRHLVPVGVATNFIIDGTEVVVPFATDEPSCIAGASSAAKLARACGGFITSAGPNICTGQVVFLASGPDSLARLTDFAPMIVAAANRAMPGMTERTGGTDSVDIRQIDTDSGLMLAIDLHVKVGDSMGANAVTGACESIRTLVHSELGFEPLMGIVTNLARKRIVSATGRWRISDLSFDDYDGFDIANRIIMAANFARVDPTRAATHRKGIMNGISAVVLATGNDTRAVESAVHSYATLPDSNPALTLYRIDGQELVGEIAIPMPVGTVGGSICRAKTAEAVRKLMKIESADGLAKVIAAVGLAQNFAALRALVSQGITAGHMKVHSREIASHAGATEAEVEAVATKLVRSGSISVLSANSILREMRCELT